jgi:hypothetical protein
MRTKLWLPAVLGLSMIVACAKKPTLEECQQAVNHIFDLMKKESTEQMKKAAEQMGVQIPEKAQADPSKGFEEMQNSAIGKMVRNSHLAACQKQPQTRATCVSNATTLEELVNVCKMKASHGGPRGGGVTITWPD